MSKIIQSYQLYNNGGSNSVSLHKGSKPFTVTYHMGKVTLWVMEDNMENAFENRNFVVAGEYGSLGDNFYIYIGSVTYNDGSVTEHIFEDKGYS